jgi:hypothetical protein
LIQRHEAGLERRSKRRVEVADVDFRWHAALLTLAQYLFLELAHQGQLETIGAVIVFQKVFFRGRVEDWNS